MIFVRLLSFHKLSLLLSFSLFVIPASTSYKLDTYSFGSGGVTDATSSQYALEGISGELGSGNQSSTAYRMLPGILSTQLANQPLAPTLTNVNLDYNKLLLQIDSGNNPSDARFAVAISSDNFVTTMYVQNDNTVGSVLGGEDWQTYAQWGSTTGEYIVGLNPDTTYQVKVKAEQGAFTEGSWCQTATGATQPLTLSFDIDVSATDQETASPYTLPVGTLSPGTVVTGTEKMWLDLETNAALGGTIYVYGSQGGLYSSAKNYTIAAVTGNLTALAEGMGLQSLAVTQSSGGPLVAVSPFDGSSDTVGAASNIPAPLFNTSNAKIVAGRGEVIVKAKASQITPSSSDYTENITVIAVANF